MINVKIISIIRMKKFCYSLTFFPEKLKFLKKILIFLECFCLLTFYTEWCKSYMALDV